MLLTDDAEQSTATTTNLPTNEDVLKALKTQNTDAITQYNEVAVNRLVIVMWADDKGQYCWYVGYLTRDQERKLVADHTEREHHSSNKSWRYPSKPDVHHIEESQILGVDVKGEWQYESLYNKFILTNEKEILYTFKSETV